MMQQLSILIVGDTESAEAAQRLLEDNADSDVRVLTRNRVDDGLVLRSSDTGIALVLLLWEDAPEQLPDLVRSIFAQQSNPMLAVLVRSQIKLPQEVSATLWHLGVADRSFYQPITSTELADSVAVALRNYRRQITLSEVAALSGIFSDARTLRDLALLSLLVVHDQQIPARGGLFCYLGSSAERRPMLITGTGYHENHSGIPLERLDDALAKSMIQAALDQRQSHFGAEGAAIYLHTPGGYTACIYFALYFPLRPWEIGVLRTISNMIATAIDQSQLAHHLLRTQQATITTLSTLAEYRDTDTGEHVARVARMTTEITQMLSEENEDIDDGFLEQVGLASILHDTGKIAIPDSILLKPGPLDPQERQAMEQHVIFGHEILSRAARRTNDGGLLKMSAEIARYHHERFDGTGYPKGLKGEDIPLSARIVALVDVYDALTCKRPYKLPWPHEKAVELIRKESGRHFDPKVVDAFLRLDETKKSACLIKWNDSMSVGNADLDLDHQRLIEIINRLWVADSMGNRQIIEFVLDDLVNYTEYHFAREEQLIEKAGFPDSERHSISHRGICRRLEEIRWEYFEGVRHELGSGLLEFLMAWLNKHILEEDMQYSSHFAVSQRVHPQETLQT